jgi:hypothetical protein
MVTLYAWAVPGFFSESPVDHTWVTTYDNQETPYSDDNKVAEAGQSYWYCWGSFHAQGGTPNNPAGALGQQAGDLALAQCLVQANADSQKVAAARGTIFTYGEDGVCHQLANQVLYATGNGRVRPLTVKGARGYTVSSFIYGTYGLQHAAWLNKIAACGSRVRTAGFGGTQMSATPTPSLPDDFEERARAVLERDDPKALADLLTLRADVQRFSAQHWPGFTAPSAEALNARNQHLLDQAAVLLGPERFESIFGFPPGQKINLVDPEIKHAGDDAPSRLGDGLLRR